MIAERAAAINKLEGKFRALSPDEAAKELAQIAQIVNNGPSGPTADKTRDVSETAREDIIAWLAEVGRPDARVRAYWISLGEGIEMFFSDFLEHYDDLWYPGADDVYVCDISGQFAIFLDHEERIAIWCGTHAAVTSASNNP